MQVMTEKGLILCSDERPHRYTAAVPEEKTQSGMLKDLLQRAFDGSAQKLLVRLVEDGGVSQKELDDLARLIHGIPKGQTGWKMTELLKAIQSSDIVYRLGWTLVHSLWLGAALGVAFAECAWSCCVGGRRTCDTWPVCPARARWWPRWWGCSWRFRLQPHPSHRPTRLGRSAA